MQSCTLNSVTANSVMCIIAKNQGFFFKSLHKFELILLCPKSVIPIQTLLPQTDSFR